MATPVGGNPQVGKVDAANIDTVLNGDQFYDDDSNPAPTEFNSPSGSVCDNKILDVKIDRGQLLSARELPSPLPGHQAPRPGPDRGGQRRERAATHRRSRPEAAERGRDLRQRDSRRELRPDRLGPLLQGRLRASELHGLPQSDAVGARSLDDGRRLRPERQRRGHLANAGAGGSRGRPELPPGLPGREPVLQHQHRHVSDGGPDVQSGHVGPCAVLLRDRQLDPDIPVGLQFIRGYSTNPSPGDPCA